MNPEATGGQRTALALRAEFDRSFAAAPAIETDLFEDLLEVQVGGDPHVLRLSELEALHADRAIIRIPGPREALLGVASFRNRILPIYDLRVLLGYPGGPAPRWIALARGAPVVGLAFDRFERWVRLRRDLVSPGEGSDGNRKHVRGAVHTDALRPVIHVASLVEAIAGRS